MDERELIEQARRDPAAFGDLFDRYHDRVYAFVFRRTSHRQDAEDLTASVFEEALAGLHRFRWQGKPFAAWLYTIASRRLADHFREARRNGAAPARSSRANRGAAPAGAPDPSDLADPRDPIGQADDAAVLSWAISRLSPADRLVVDLTYCAGLSPAEIAPVLGCSRAQVYVRLHRALRRLRRHLEGER